MRQLLPTAATVDPAAAHASAARPTPASRPWVLLNMVASVDGATALDGVSGDLGGTGDKAVFSALRAIADVILVAGGTVRAESYGPPRTPPEGQAERVARGQAPYPRLAVVTGSLDLDPRSTMFTEAPEPPLIYTVTDAPPDRRLALTAMADIHDAGTGHVELSAVLADLAARDTSVVLVEGGPTLNGQLVADGLVDEINVTVSPHLVGGDSKRLVAGAHGPLTDLTLAHLWELDGTLFTRYVRSA